MGETILFCFVFLCQVLLISWFYPRRLIGRGRYVLQNFPPSTHPKLYTHPPEDFERWLRNIARLNLVIVVAGFLIIIGLILGTLSGEWNGRIVTPWSSSGEWDAAIVIPFFFLQIAVSVMYISFSSRKFLKAAAKAPPPRVRTTELRRRQLADFVSPAMLVAVAITNIAFIAFVLYYRRFEFPWFMAAANIATVAFILLLCSVSIGMALRAPKSDPYQADEDRRRSIKLRVQQALGACIVIPVLLTAHMIIKYFDPNLLEPIIASLFCLGCTLSSLWPLYNYPVDRIDFDVYRRDAADSTSGRISSP